MLEQGWGETLRMARLWTPLGNLGGGVNIIKIYMDQYGMVVLQKEK